MTYATLMVNLESGRSNSHLLKVTAQLARRFHASVIGTTACTPIQLMYGEGYIGGEIFEQDRQEIDTEIKFAEVAFRSALGAEACELDWRSAVTFLPLADHLAAEACRADLILTSATQAEPKNAARRIDLGDFIMQAGRPVLVVGADASSHDLTRVIVGWKDTRESRRATADAMPLLKMASFVRLVEIVPAADIEAAKGRLSDVIAWLARHEVMAECRALVTDGEDAELLNAVAQENGAGVIVAGSYGHNRVREWALGGMTRSLLDSGKRTLFTSH
jgi:nucleotide-binding universal stress UspA family protein